MLAEGIGKHGWGGSTILRQNPPEYIKNYLYRFFSMSCDYC